MLLQRQNSVHRLLVCKVFCRLIWSSLFWILMVESKEFMLKLVMVGDFGVGKSCLLQRFAHQTFQEPMLSNLGIDFQVSQIQVKDHKVKLQIWDTAGQERFRTITQSYYRGAQGFFLMYDITNQGSFRHVSNWWNDIKQSSPHVPVLLVGNKADLEAKRQISITDAKTWAKEHGHSAKCVVETSAKTGTGVAEAFEVLAQTILETPSTLSPKKQDSLTPVQPNSWCLVC